MKESVRRDSFQTPPRVNKNSVFGAQPPKTPKIRAVKLSSVPMEVFLRMRPVSCIILFIKILLLYSLNNKNSQKKKKALSSTLMISVLQQLLLRNRLLITTEIEPHNNFYSLKYFQRPPLKLKSTKRRLFLTLIDYLKERTV